MEKLLVFNWKTNPSSPKKAIRLARSAEKAAKRFGNVAIAVAPPSPFLVLLEPVLKHASLAAQDVFWGDIGAHTGEVSWHQLKTLGVRYVIIGHSERRALGESDLLINKKIKASLQAGLTVILCVGEPKRGSEIKDNELRKAKNYVKRQLQKDLKNTDKLIKLKSKKLTIAYEPVWAVGTGKSDGPGDAAEMVGFIKRFLYAKFKTKNSKVLYGGSVNSKNVGDFASRSDLDGFLVGGASLKPDEFRRIIKAIASH